MRLIMKKIKLFGEATVYYMPNWIELSKLDQ